MLLKSNLIPAHTRHREQDGSHVETHASLLQGTI
uniref:Uncharacterized protein n=1 Tax=Anguilla anguilla TaxID=7936 RepID=A0A0E9SRE2_ANGAN